jgi:TIR domain
MARRIFVSYSRRDRALVEQLVGHLKAGGHDIWLDRDIAGGTKWWDTILSEIEDREIFVVAVSEESIKSEACSLELRYAIATGRLVFPIAITTHVDTKLLPDEIASLQILPYADPTIETSIALTRHFDLMPLAPELPTPRPPRPSAPISYIVGLRDRIKSTERLTADEQVGIVRTLKESLLTPEDRHSAIDLLHLMRSRSDLYATADRDVADTLRRTQEEDAAGLLPPPLGAPIPFAPPSPVQAKGRSRTPAMIAVVALAVSGIAGGSLLLRNHSGAGRTTDKSIRSSALLQLSTTSSAPPSVTTAVETGRPGSTTSEPVATASKAGARPTLPTEAQLGTTQLVSEDEQSLTISAGAIITEPCSDREALAGVPVVATGSVAEGPGMVFASQAGAFATEGEAAAFVQNMLSVAPCRFQHGNGVSEAVIDVHALDFGIQGAAAVSIQAILTAPDGSMISSQDLYFAIGRFIGVESCAPVPLDACSQLGSIFGGRLGSLRDVLG